jgi:hypothetical protein
LSPRHSEVLRVLRSRQQPLYALLDAARAPAVPALLTDSGERHECLYSGGVAQELAEYAPYLVQLDKNGALVPRLVEAGWDDAWGYYLISESSFERLRTHLRKFLLVKLEDGREVYFRFYDPRVIRAFLHVATLQQAAKLLEEVSGVICAGNEPDTLLTFHMAGNRLVRNQIPLGQ